MQEQFFKDLKVLELASVLAGPAVGMFFAELGAQVIKVENKKTGGDISRKWKLPSEDKAKSDSAYYHCINWNKESLFLDLNNPQDLSVLMDLISKADVVISNYKYTFAKKLGIDYKNLKTKYPQLIYAQLYAFGKAEDRIAFDIVLQAEAGFLYMNGEPGRDPVKMPVALIDLLAGHQLKQAILLALIRRQKTGKGSYVETNLLQSALSSLANQATNWLMESHIPQAMGAQHPNIAPYGDLYYTKDHKLIVLAIGTDRQFSLLCDCLSVPQLSKDERFADNQSRVRNRELLNLQLSESIKKMQLESLTNQFLERGVPFGRVRDMKEVFELPTARAMILEQNHPNRMVSKRLKTIAFKIR